MLELIASQAANGKQTLAEWSCHIMRPLQSCSNYITDRRSRDRNAAAQTRKYVAWFADGLNPNAANTANTASAGPKKEEPISLHQPGFMGVIRGAEQRE